MTTFTPIAERNNTKDKRGDLGIQLWLKNRASGTLNYAMRFGKTFVGIKVCENSLLKNSDIKIIILTPSEVVSSTWDGYVKYYLDASANITIMTRSKMIDTITKQIELSCDLLIVDEIHKFTTDAAYQSLIKIKQRFILGLTGTYPSGEAGRMLSKIAPVVDTITEQEALDNNWIAPYEEFNLVIEFPDKDKELYAKLTEPIAETLQLFRGTANDLNRFMKSKVFKTDYNVIDACFRGISTYDIYGKIIRFDALSVRSLLAHLKGWNHQLDLTSTLNKQIDDNWSPQIIDSRARAFDKQIRLRNNLMIMHPLKLKMVSQIIDRTRKPTIVFNEATDFADMVCDKVNKLGDINSPICTVYHSNIESRFLRDESGHYITYKTGNKVGEPKVFGKTSLKADAIDGMMSGRYLCISTARALDEGLSIPNIELVITTGGTTNPIQYKQRSARGKTVNLYNPDKKAMIINIVFDDFYENKQNEEGETVLKRIKSRDLTKLVERQGINNDVKWVHTIDEILLPE